jgi:hypothetical protein
MHFLGLYQNTVEAYGIQRSDIYNLDEIDFRIGQGRLIENVYTRYPDSVPSIDSSSQRLLVTSIECISCDGYVLSPFIWMPGRFKC